MMVPPQQKVACCVATASDVAVGAAAGLKFAWSWPRRPNGHRRARRRPGGGACHLVADADAGVGRRTHFETHRRQVVVMMVVVRRVHERVQHRG